MSGPDAWTSRPDAAALHAAELGIPQTAAPVGGELWTAWSDRVAQAWECLFDLREARRCDSKRVGLYAENYRRAVADAAAYAVRGA